MLIDSLYDARLSERTFINIERLYQEYPNEINIIYRMARSFFDKAEQETDINIQKKYYYEGFQYAKRALRMNSENGYANFWYAAFIGKIGELEGNRQKILNSYEVKKYGMKAIELEPNYDACYHLMGRWHFELADLSWMERSIASLVYDAPPKGSYNKAISFFKNAIKLDPKEIRHHYWLARTYYALGKYKLANKEFVKVIKLKALDKKDKLMQIDSKKYL